MHPVSGVHDNKYCSDKLIVVFVNLLFIIKKLSATAAEAKVVHAPHEAWFLIDVTTPCCLQSKLAGAPNFPFDGGTRIVF